MFSKRSSHLTTSVTCFNKFNKNDNKKKVKKLLHNRDIKYLCYLLDSKPFKYDEKCFLFHLKSSFRSQDI